MVNSPDCAMHLEEGIDFADLSSDTDFKKTVLNFHNSIGAVENILNLCTQEDIYSKLSTEDKVKYDIFIAYSLNSLFWMYLRSQGEVPANHPVKSELERIRGYMMKAKQIHDRKTLMPHLDKEAAKRFIKGGLWTPTQNDKRAHKRKRIEDD